MPALARALLAMLAAGGISTSAVSLMGDDQAPSAPPNTEKTPGDPMPADQAARTLRLPDGFHVSVFAAEPDVQNPIACAWDSRGRLWVAENHTYAEREQRFDLSLKDRVLILDDRDGDGRMDRRTVFTDDVQMLTSVEVGFGGVWLMCPPQLLFVPDRDQNDQPDGPAQVVLDGFTVPAENYHNFANGLKWGPDGWLYGRCGASAPGELGPPGTPPPQRIPLRGGLWRYHPTRKVVEVLTSGTTNPWGHDWNALGEAFFINTVNGHLWHAIPGAHFVRPHTIDPNPYVYTLIDQHADHWHWDQSKDWTDSRNVTGEHDRLGGGHAHSGLLIYQADQWPEAYRGKLLTLNLHGRRTNVERLDRQGSGYVAKHEPDILHSGDPFFRGIDLTCGPDGGVYILDWSDTGECHENTGVHRQSGRFYKVTRGKAEPHRQPDLATYPGNKLVELLSHQNEWFVRQARRILAERAAQGHPMTEEADLLRSMLHTTEDPVLKIRALSSLHAMNLADAPLLRPLLTDPHEAVRAWGVRLLTDALPLDTPASQRPVNKDHDLGLTSELLHQLASMATDDESAQVRLTLASTLQRLPHGQRPVLAAPLLSHAEDAHDHNLPLMLWYGLIPLGESDPDALADLASKCTIPTTRQLIVRRLAEILATNPAPIERLMTWGAGPDADDHFRADLLAGLVEGLRGVRKSKKPSSWDALAGRLAAASDPRIVETARELAVVFGDGRALDQVKALALDAKAPLDTRRAALRSLIEARVDDLRSICETLLGTRFLNSTALAGLELFDDPAIGDHLATSYRTFHPSERGAVLDTLVSRPTFARALLHAVAAGKIPRADVTAFHARRIRSLGNDELTSMLSAVWGELRDSPDERKASISAWRSRLTANALAAADLSQGRSVFNELCATCHRLYGQGGEIGPDLTGAGRDNLDYLLENILDPSAVVTADFRMVVLAMADGRVLNGIVLRRDDRSLTLQTDKEQLVLPREEIEEERASAQSLMPDGLLQPLPDERIRDLFAYLMHRTQVPLPASTTTGEEKP